MRSSRTAIIAGGASRQSPLRSPRVWIGIPISLIFLIVAFRGQHPDEIRHALSRVDWRTCPWPCSCSTPESPSAPTAGMSCCARCMTSPPARSSRSCSSVTPRTTCSPCAPASWYGPGCWAALRRAQDRRARHHRRRAALRWRDDAPLRRRCGDSRRPDHRAATCRPGGGRDFRRRDCRSGDPAGGRDRARPPDAAGPHAAARRLAERVERMAESFLAGLGRPLAAWRSGAGGDHVDRGLEIRGLDVLDGGACLRRPARRER